MHWLWCFRRRYLTKFALYEECTFAYVYYYKKIVLIFNIYKFSFIIIIIIIVVVVVVVVLTFIPPTYLLYSVDQLGS